MKKPMRVLRSVPWEAWIVLGVTAAVVALVVLLVRAIDAGEAANEAQWESFRAEHHCFVLGRQSSYWTSGSGIAVTPKGGVAPVFTSDYVPARATWRCDDGIDYTRDE